MGAIDKRENILLQMMAILEKLKTAAPGDGGAASVTRDRDQLPNSNIDTLEKSLLPGIVMLDGKEALNTNIRGQQMTQMPPAYFTMEPQVWLMLPPRDRADNLTLNEQAAPVGPELSKWRAKILKAVLKDPNLILKVGSGGQIEYRGCETDMMIGATIVGQMMLQFAITYPFNVADL